MLAYFFRQYPSPPRPHPQHPQRRNGVENHGRAGGRTLLQSRTAGGLVAPQQMGKLRRGVARTGAPSPPYQDDRCAPPCLTRANCARVLAARRLYFGLPYLRKKRTQSVTPTPTMTNASNGGYMKVRMAAAAMDMGRVELNHIPKISTVVSATRMREVKHLPWLFGAPLLRHSPCPLALQDSAGQAPE